VILVGVREHNVIQPVRQIAERIAAISLVVVPRHHRIDENRDFGRLQQHAGVTEIAHSHAIAVVFGRIPVRSCGGPQFAEDVCLLGPDTELTSNERTGPGPRPHGRNQVEAPVGKIDVEKETLI